MIDQLKLQAFFDQELSPSETREVTEWLARDAQSAALLEELAWTKSALKGNEAEVKLPETREFYWGQIAREIERQEAVPPVARPAFAAWLRWLVPVTSLGAVALLLVMSVKPEGSALNETEGELEAASVFSFHSQPEKMSVIWVQSEANQEFSTPSDETKVERNDNN